MKNHYDIAIIGAGLVGATMAAAIANEPANQHLNIVVIDQGNEPVLPDLQTEPPVFDARVVALTHASIELMQSIGAWSTILEQRACHYRYMRVWDDEGTAEINFDANELQQDSLGVIVENRILLCAVLASLKNFDNVTLIRQQSIDGLENIDAQDKQEEKIKQLILSDGSRVQACLIIAADGAHSRIRELAGIATRSWSYDQKAIVTTVKSEQSHQFTAWQNFLTTGPLAFLPLDDASERYCSIVWSVDSKRADELMQLGDVEFMSALGMSFENRLGQIESIDKRFCFPLMQRHVVDYIAPQLALVGDAAHTIHPLAGQGVNLGLLDAQALAAEITRSSKRSLSLADESILRRYQRERKRHNLELMLLMEGFKRLFGSRNLAARWLRNSGIRKIDSIKPVKKWLAKQAMRI